MKSPEELSARLRRQWNNADTREARLLGGAWPIELTIRRPTSKQLINDLDAVRNHVDRWRRVRIGEVAWQSVRYRAASDEVEIPVVWKIHQPIEWMDACADRAIRAEFQSLTRLIQETDAIFHESFVRRRSLWRDKELDEVVQSAHVALALTPGCAAGRPLRLLSIEGIDTKFFERNARLVTALMDDRYDCEVSRIGLEAFLGAMVTGDHWLLLVDLDGSLLPFRKQRVRSREFGESELPGDKLLIIENEACEHLLPNLPQTLAVLGTGFDLGWIDADRLAGKQIGYWGDLDTWGLQFLATARSRLPNLKALMMTKEIYDRFQDSTVVEPLVAGTEPPMNLQEPERRLYEYLISQERGWLEQEFLPEEFVHEAISNWAKEPARPYG